MAGKRKRQEAAERALACVKDAPLAAKEAGLRYTTDARPGIRRKGAGKGFAYIGPNGDPIRDEATLARIRSLAIPPAYRDVWIAPDPRGHLQATGRDARGRKQYRYHPRWRETREATKYDRMIAFGQALPHIREQAERDLRRQGLPREKVLAAIVRLLEKTLIRVGSEEYARDNKSYGLTTMRDRHVKVGDAAIRFTFRGKSGVDHKIALHDRRLARIVKRCRDLPGQELFQYLDEDGQRQSIDSADVNDYLHGVAGEAFTAKDFRTWAGTVLCSVALQEFDPAPSEAEAKRNVVAAIKRVAERLGNTPAVCRKSYVHPAILDGYLDGTMLETLREMAAEELQRSQPGTAGLEPEEAQLLRLLMRQAGR